MSAPLPVIKLPVRIEEGGFLVGADHELISHLPEATDAEKEAIVALMNRNLPPTQRIHVCTTCGSPRVFADAYASLNTDEVRTYDDTNCDDCEGECKTQWVEVPADFDLDTDFYKEDK